MPIKDPTDTIEARQQRTLRNELADRQGRDQHTYGKLGNSQQKKHSDGRIICF